MLQAHQREQSRDQAFRYGGEEFCMIMPTTEIKPAIALMEKFRKNLAQEMFYWEEQELKVTVSVGVACTEQFDHAISLFEAADSALYFAKDHGRNQVAHFENGNIWNFEGKPFAPKARTSKKPDLGT
jgi:diguanylate cyclase (GGDEF)-like protein